MILIYSTLLSRLEDGTLRVSKKFQTFSVGTLRMSKQVLWVTSILLSHSMDVDEGTYLNKTLALLNT